MKILVANLGSTSLKYRLFDFSGGAEKMLARGGIERVTDYSQAIDSCLCELQKGGWIENESDLAAVGFKTIMARGINGCVKLDEHVVRAMEEYNAIAPAHNPPYIIGIRMFAQRMPKVPLIGLFETAFYQWAPEASMRYAVPETWLEAGVRRWGFHGASHKFIAERSAEMLCREDVARRARSLYVDGNAGAVANPPLRVISCHLGGSSSVTGILNGVAIGNSMGTSPQSGLPQNNRVGDLDASALAFVMEKLGLTLEEAQRQLCKESGLKGLSGGYNDFRDVQEQAEKGNPRAKLAIDVLVDSTRHWIGAYYLKLNSIDSLVFTAGIGENRAEVREAICQNLDQLGIILDPALNAKCRACEAIISAPESRVKILVIPTNEELVVAREARRFLQANSKN
ncbi:MAG TPA: acetate kinase [Verrucomicrobiae bacterium]|nr:acetate kinase [Verrucomicrobiae bacterium]